MSEKNCMKCRVCCFKEDLCEESFCKKYWGEGNSEDFINAVKKPEWIPCSEKLPEEAQECFITAKDGTVLQGMFTRRYGERRDSGFICNGFSFAWLNSISAWMPYEMPEPYKEDEE